MISRTEAERVAVAIHALRGDWPITSICTLIIRDLTTWAYRDLAAALAYIAADQNADGTWRSATPARVKESGPWLTTNADQIAARQRATDEARQRHEAAQIRNQAVAHCQLCDDHGYLPTGRLCLHDEQVNNPPVHQWIAKARAEIRRCNAPNLHLTTEQTDSLDATPRSVDNPNHQPHV